MRPINAMLGYYYPNKKNSRVLGGYHRVVILSTRRTPYNTKLIAPITSAKALRNRNKIPSNYFELKKEDYPMILDNDSYVNLDMIMAVDEKDLKPLLSRNGCVINSNLNSRDSSELSRKIAETFELQGFVEEEVEKETKKEIDTVVEYLNTEVRDELEKILTNISDNDTKEKLKNLLDNSIINEINKIYTFRNNV